MEKRAKTIPHKSSEKTPYEVLGVRQAASFDEIRKAYIEKVRQFPPEKDPENFKKIRQAYGFLKDGENKRRLDLSLFHEISGLEVDTAEDPDFAALFKSCIIELLMVSSDLYVHDFSKCFRDIDLEVRNLA